MTYRKSNKQDDLDYYANVPMTVRYFLQATLFLYITLTSVVGVSQGFWLGCRYVYAHWWVIFQLPFYWVALVCWLLLIIFGCFVISACCLVYRKCWNSVLRYYYDLPAA